MPPILPIDMVLNIFPRYQAWAVQIKGYKFNLEYVQCIRFLVTFVLARYSLLANGSDYPLYVARPRFQVWCDEVGSDTRNVDNTAQPRWSPKRVEHLFDDSIKIYEGSVVITPSIFTRRSIGNLARLINPLLDFARGLDI